MNIHMYVSVCIRVIVSMTPHCFCFHLDERFKSRTLTSFHSHFKNPLRWMIGEWIKVVRSDHLISALPSGEVVHHHQSDNFKNYVQMTSAGAGLDLCYVSCLSVCNDFYFSNYIFSCLFNLPFQFLPCVVCFCLVMLSCRSSPSHKSDVIYGSIPVCLEYDIRVCKRSCIEISSFVHNRSWFHHQK